MPSKNQRGISRFVQALKDHPEFGGAFVYHRHVPAQPPVYGAESIALDGVQDGLGRTGVPGLYSHQAEALAHLKRGAHVIVATPTASGKSLIYNLAVLKALLKDKEARALYVFPLKALEQDQLKNLRTWLTAMGHDQIFAEIYDGDTTAYRRQKIWGQPPQILFTTPDMLHQAILAHHGNWEGVLARLAFVILDEVHTYRGIFGSHVNQVIRRLKRLCRHYGADPRFILSSATVSNPKQFGEGLLGEPLEVVQASGAPAAGRHFLFLNAAAGANFTAAKLFVDCIRRGYRTIAFTQSRKVTELISLWVSQLAPSLREQISSYRAGFTPDERRDIEGKLAGGRLLGVVSTSALEMGIDIGYLDVCLLVGYPGTIINAWQRGGRVGRSGRESLVILLAKPDALDQYFMAHPEEFFERGCEAAVVDPHNPYVTSAHLPCAAAEKPLTLADAAFWPEDLPQHLESLETKGALYRTAEGAPTWFSTRLRPHRHANMRSVGEGYRILEKGNAALVGTVDGVRAFTECHPGAVYLHRGRQYLIDDLNLTKREILARPAKVAYFTRVQSEKETQILEVHRSRSCGFFIVGEGRLRVTQRIMGYEKRAVRSHTLLGASPLSLPPLIFETVGLWVEVEEEIKDLIEKRGLRFMGGIHAVEHAAIGMFPLFCLCDRNDIGGIAYDFHPGIGKSAIFIYDGHPGGMGLAQHGFEVILELLKKTLAHVRTCACKDGCPSCIQSPKCGSGNRPLDKEAAMLVLEALLGLIPLSLSRLGRPDGSGPLTASLPSLPSSSICPHTGPAPRLVFFDLETQRLATNVGGWQNTHLMGVSVAVAYDSLDQQFFVYEEADMDGLIGHLHRADLVVGFNVKTFDYKVLSAYTRKALARLPTFDILEDIYRRLGFRLSLDHLAQETLNRGKTADGLQAVKWFQEGNMKKLTDYCRNDVIITRDLFRHGLDEGHLVFRSKQQNQKLRVPVSWQLKALISGASA